MPKQYVAIRKRLEKANRAKGMKPKQAHKQAQSSAAAIYNSEHPEAPISGSLYDRAMAKKKR